jgi:hypothetical protein
MTIKEIRDQFLGQYEIQSQVKGIKRIRIGDKMLAFFISSAQQDIQRRLAVVESTTDITLLTTTNEYSLPSNFGQHKHAYVGSTPLDEKPERFIREQIAAGNSGYWYGIYVAGNTQKLITPISSGTLTLYYYPDLRYYQPSISSDQDWGNFSGTVFTGKLILPDRYDQAVLYFMLAQIMPDYYGMYEKEVKSLRESRISSADEGMQYHFGGVEDLVPAVAGTTAAVTLTAGGGFAGDKVLRFRASDDGGAATVGDAIGWTTTPTIANNITSIVVTSADSEFTNYIHTQPTNLDFTWSQTGATTITIYPDPTTGWGSVEIILEVWD